MKREMVLEIIQRCQQAYTDLADVDYSMFFEGLDRLKDKADKRGAKILTFHSTKYGETKVEVKAEVREKEDKIIYRMKGDLNGTVTLAFIQRGDRCRLYIEAEGDGKIIDEHGGEALLRIINRIGAYVLSNYTGRILPTVTFRLGDMLADAIMAIEIAAEGVEQAKGEFSDVKTLVVSVEGQEGAVLSASGLSPEEAKTVGAAISAAYSVLERMSDALKKGQIGQIAMISERAVYLVQVSGGIATVTIFEKQE